jgi:N-dimethylarginine dimethylaminohydrolase
LELGAACQTEVSKLERVLLKHAKDAFVDEERIDREWRPLHYGARPDLGRARSEYDSFVEILERLGVEIDYLPAAEQTGLDSIYVRDASVLTREGLVLCQMGKPQRRGEPEAQAAHLRQLGLPILGAIEGEGRLEGGDVAWIDERTLAVGRGYRTNDEGIDQLRRLVDGCVDEMVVVPLPHWRGPDDVFHLMSFLSPIDHDLALVYSPLLSVPFRQMLLERGHQLVEVPDSEFETMGCNVLAVGPRRCLALSGNPETRRRLERAGAEVHEYDGREISIKGGGGPTCLTRPLFRGA